MAEKKGEKNAAETKPAAEVEEAPKKGGIGALMPLILTIVLMPALAYATTMFILVPQIKSALSVSARTPDAGDAHGADAHGDDAHGADSHGADSHGADSHGADAHGADSHGADSHGADSHGADSHGGGHGDSGGGHGGGHGGGSAGSKTYQLEKVVVNIKNTLGQRYLIVEMVLEGADTTFSTSVESMDHKFLDLANGILRQKSIQDLEQDLAQDIIRSELKNSFNNFLSKGKEPLVKAIYFRSFAIQ